MICIVQLELEEILNQNKVKLICSLQRQHIMSQTVVKIHLLTQCFFIPKYKMVCYFAIDLQAEIYYGYMYSHMYLVFKLLGMRNCSVYFPH